MKTLHLMAAVTGAATLLVGCSSLLSSKDIHSDTSDIKPIAAVGSIPQRVELEQAWNEDTRRKFWYTSQGARIIPYTWFSWLEQADNEKLFRSAEHMESLRYLPMPSSPENPAGLPIGFALATDAKTGEGWMGMTCAACHTNQVDYNGTKMLIEGAPTLGNFVLFYSKLVDALNATHLDDAKFDRFAHRVLDQEYSTSAASQLRDRLGEIALHAAERREVNALPADYPKDFTSYARLDAFGNIQNAGSVFALHDLANGNAPTAPVSYPFLWGTHQSDVVQWNASAPNTPVVGPLVRNMGEVVGVFGGLEITKAPVWQRWLLGKQTRYSSTINMMALGHLESYVRDLRSPVWPSQYLPAVDTNKAAEGAVLYANECASCHQVIPRADEGKKYVAVRSPVAEMKTDPIMAWNAEYHQAKSLILEGEKTKILIGDRFGENAPAIQIPVNGVVGLVLKDPVTAFKAGMIPYKSGTQSEPEPTEAQVMAKVQEHINARKTIEAEQDSPNDNGTGYLPSGERDLNNLVYKSRPLNGIWATAPYLHNGSVPNLWELLQKPEQRASTFWVGSREFDPVNVGFVTGEGLNEFRVYNNKGEIQLGNSNRGHDFGTELSDAQKWALVEYMKTL